MSDPHRGEPPTAPVTEEQILWIFGSPRTGSTWLMQMLVELSGATAISEPLIGGHLGLPDYPWIARARYAADGIEGRGAPVTQHGGYFFSEATAPVWKPLLRDLLLARFGVGAGAGPVIVKEPNGSRGAPILVDTLPGSRLILLVRDGRDVVDSLLDGMFGGWLEQWSGPEVDRAATVRRLGHLWVDNVRSAQAAFDALPVAQRHLVRYEDLLVDAAGELRAMAERFGFDGDVEQVAAAHAFEIIPAEHKGKGRFHRAATPGLWREHLSADEQAALHDVMGATLAGRGYPIDAP